MTKTTIVKSVVGVTSCLYLALLFQTSIFPRIPLAGVVPNLVLAVVSLFSFLKGTQFGMLTGFVGGILLDVFCGSYFGMYALIFTYIGLMNGLLSIIFFGDDIKLPLFLVGGSDIVFGAIVYATMFLLNGDNDFSFYATNVMIPEAVYTAVIALFIYYPIKSICEWMDKETNSRTRETPGMS